MTKQLSADPKDFMNDIKRSKPCFLLGNGICRYHNAPDWSQVIRQVINKIIDDKKELEVLQKYIEANNIPNAGYNCPEIYTSLLLATGISKSKEKFKKELKSILDKSAPCGLLQYVRKTKAQILTTNFDFAIERTLGFHAVKAKSFNFSKVKDSEDYYKSEVYPYTRYMSDEKHDDLYLEKATAGQGDTGRYITDECAVWHIHGSINSYQSIQLGFEDYMNAIIHLKQLQDNSKDQNGKKQYAEPWEDHFVLKNSWLRLFFTRPLVIVGCAINSEELFLRWLLLRRQRQDIIRNDDKHKDKKTQLFKLPATYYLDTQEELKKQPKGLDKARKQYFNSLGIKVVRFNTFRELYDGPQWGEDFPC